MTVGKVSAPRCAADNKIFLLTNDLAARAQPRERMRRVGVLTSLDENDAAAKFEVSAFTPALADLRSPWFDSIDGHAFGLPSRIPPRNLSIPGESRL